MRSNGFPFTGGNQAQTEKLLIGAVVKRAICFSEMASFCIWKGMVQKLTDSPLICRQSSSSLTWSGSLIKQAEPVSGYKTERISTLALDAPCPGKMHISLHPWKKRQLEPREELYLSSQLNTHTHPCFSPIPTHLHRTPTLAHSH